MEIKKDFVLREVGGTYVIVATGPTSKNFKKIVTLNESGAFIFRKLKENFSINDVKAAVLEEYDINDVQVDKDINQFINTLKENNIVD